MLGRLSAGRGRGNGRVVFFVGFGRFEAGIDDQVEKVGGPEPAVGTLEDCLAQALTSNDDDEVTVVAEGGLD